MEVFLPAISLAVSLVPRVVVEREGERTNISIQSDGHEPWPLPEGASRESATPVPADAFDEIDLADAPTLEDVWQTDPCPEVADMDLEGGGPHTPSEKPRPPEPPPPPPRRHVNAHTTAPGYRITTSSPALRLPVLPAVEVVIHVLAPTTYQSPGDSPPALLPEIVVPVGLRGSFPELYGAILERAARLHPGVPLREYAGTASLSTSTLASLGHSAGYLSITRFHIRPPAGADHVELVPGGKASPGLFEVVHPWSAPVRCVDPEEERHESSPRIPVAPIAAGSAPSPDDFSRIELPGLDLHGRPWWVRVPPFDRGALLGGGLAIGLSFGARRRRR
jgi:hypothetical protein